MCTSDDEDAVLAGAHLMATISAYHAKSKMFTVSYDAFVDSLGHNHPEEDEMFMFPNPSVVLESLPPAVAPVGSSSSSSIKAAKKKSLSPAAAPANQRGGAEEFSELSALFNTPLLHPLALPYARRKAGAFSLETLQAKQQRSKLKHDSVKPTEMMWPSDGNPVGKRVSVFWRAENQWYAGQVVRKVAAAPSAGKGRAGSSSTGSLAATTTAGTPVASPSSVFSVQYDDDGAEESMQLPDPCVKFVDMALLEGTVVRPLPICAAPACHQLMVLMPASCSLVD
jgi:hypothetical protein